MTGAKGVAMSRQGAATPALSRLDPFEGAWDTAGEVLGESPIAFGATDEYEWVAAGHFLLHRFVAHMPDGDVSGIEVIGHSAETDTYSMHSFDSSGSSAAMTAAVDGDRWVYTGELTRFTGGFSADGQLFSGLWETRGDATSDLQPWMRVRLTKRSR
jgi:hypothetical protein